LYSRLWWSQLYLLEKTESITIIERNNISATTAFNHTTLEKIEEVEDRCGRGERGVAHLAIADDPYNTIETNTTEIIELEELRRFKL
jgi:hypothetical protein